MTLKQRLGEDMKAALKAKDSARLSAIRLAIAAVKQKEIDERIEADDAQVMSILDKLLKQRRDSITQFEQAGRQDLADKERFEMDVLSAYLPQQASPQEIAAEIDAAIASVTGAGPAPGPQDMGKVMAVLKGRLAGRADLSAVSAQVRGRLAARA